MPFPASFLDELNNRNPIEDVVGQYVSPVSYTHLELLRLFIQRIEIGERDVKYSRNSSQSIRIIYRDIGTLDSAMQPDEKQPKLLPPLSEIIPFPA